MSDLTLFLIILLTYAMGYSAGWTDNSWWRGRRR